MNDFGTPLERIESLRKLINVYNFKYYMEDNPQVSDKAYDNYFSELVALEKKYPQFYSPHSPTNKIGHVVVSGLKNVKHEYDMMSLDKKKSIDEIIEWAEQIGELSYTAMHKADGLALELLYKYDDSIGASKLVRASTRGNGVVGEDVTHNVMTFENIPYTLPIEYDAVFYGEGVIKCDKFFDINNNLPPERRFKTPRNLAAGSIRQFDSSVCKSRELVFIAYGARGLECKTESELLETLYDFGFTVIPYEVVTCKTYSELEKSFEKYAKNVEKLIQDNRVIFNIDGVVFKVNKIAHHKKIGFTDRYPKFAMCYKFEDDEFETVLRDIEVNIARTGRANPVAIFDNVVIDGTDVCRATLNNIDFIESLELAIGDKIIVRKSNMIIPEIIENITRGGSWTMPEECPSCGSRLFPVRKDKTVFYYCKNKYCIGKFIAKMDHFCERDAMNILGLSESKLTFLHEHGYVNSFIDLYKLTDKHKALMQISRVQGWGKQSVDNMVKSINNSRSVMLNNFIYALGIDMVGGKTALDLAELSDWDLLTFMKLCRKKTPIQKNIGFKIGENLHAYFSVDSHVREVYHLSKHLSFIEPENIDIIDNALDGAYVCLTGKFNGMNRTQFSELVISHGGEFMDTVNKKTNYLVVGTSPHNGKMSLAEKFGTKQIDNEEFSKLIGEK